MRLLRGLVMPVMTMAMTMTTLTACGGSFELSVGTNTASMAKEMGASLSMSSGRSSSSLSNGVDLDERSPFHRYYDPVHGIHQSIGPWPRGPQVFVTGSSFQLEGALIMGYKYSGSYMGSGRHVISNCYMVSYAPQGGLSGASMFSSGDPGCEGQLTLGQNIFLADVQSAENPRALYRCYNERTGDHLDSTSPDECTNNGYRVEGILGWGA